ncbi:hypothetical protein O159_04130 [Leifsonia xyli subsp. cynodontis DSM 46306]|uniref:ABC transporter substrate-binding protein n=1 Tax=Leifsonia xyli subsp. cynodontis DSM 46306 TaxID=1389489 RepID=U3P2R9_LEIXC|nr:choice-of-anchor M domain-containing protein [Leifsonia xyli]AGW40620.1 hypothetical protein O159_04130 [Leifsonia xyli subsp. cynodontis DSM 46306]
MLGKHVHGEIDPHLWQNVRNVEAYVKLIRDTLTAKDPGGAAGYRANTERYLIELDQTDKYVRDTIARIPKANRYLVTTHDGFAYLAEAYGIPVAGFVTPNPATDDAARANKDAPSVWRYPDETVLRVVDAAKLTVPAGSAYSFVGAAPGAVVWVVPQTQNPDVVWTGWNTQDPTVVQRINRGATFSVDGVQGPGILTVYLQSGDFGAPQVLWDSRKSGPQDIFVDTNTHTHANWVFTKPGVYLVRMTASATLIDGSAVSDTQLLRFAVGSGTPTSDAATATWTGAAPERSARPSLTGSGSVPPGSGAAGGQGPLVPILIVAIAVVAVALTIGFATATVRGGQAKKRFFADRASSPLESDEGSGA